jgi:hypothetical protein
MYVCKISRRVDDDKNKLSMSECVVRCLVRVRVVCEKEQEIFEFYIVDEIRD